MSIDLVLKPSCYGCQSTAELYGSACKHLTLCVTCGKKMAEGCMCCRECGAPLTRLIREYNVHACSTSDKNYFIGRFVTGLPNFSKKKAENKWSLQKEGLQGRQIKITDTLQEKYKNKPWLLEDEGGSQYQGQLEGSQSATYYLLMLQGGEFKARPAGSWYNFNKVAQYKQLSLEEAEEKMKNRRKTADGYERWMMKAANNGAAAFGEVERIDVKEGGSGGGKGGRKKNEGDDEEANASDRGDEDEDEEASRRNRLGLRKKGGDDDEEGLRGGDFDLDDDIEKGDDWEHEEIFTDDDEASAIHPEEREDLAPEIPAPPEIKNDEEDEDEGEEEDGGGGGGLSKSGKELKKLLGRANGLYDLDDSDDDDDDDDVDTISPVLAPKKKAVKQEHAEDKTSSKPTVSASAKGTPPTSKSAKGKRKISEEIKGNGTPLKKSKSETDVKPGKSESPSAKGTATPKAAPAQPPAPWPASTPPTSPVTEEEIRAVLLGPGPVTTQNLVEKFKPRLRKREDKDTFAAILRGISKIQKTSGSSYVVLRP